MKRTKSTRLVACGRPTSVAVAGAAALCVALSACGAANRPVATAPATPSASPSVETSPSPSSSPTTAEVGPLGYDPMTFEGYSPEHPATPADFKPIPKDATPAEIEKDFDTALNMVVASNDPNLWQEVRSLYVDLKPTSDGSTYGADNYISLVYSQNEAGNNPNFGIGPSIEIATLTKGKSPRFVEGLGGTPIVLISDSQKTVKWNDTDKAYTTIDTQPEFTATFVYKTDIPTPDGKTTSGWVQADPANYGVRP